MHLFRICQIILGFLIPVFISKKQQTEPAPSRDRKETREAESGWVVILKGQIQSKLGILKIKQHVKKVKTDYFQKIVKMSVICRWDLVSKSKSEKIYPCNNYAENWRIAGNKSLLARKTLNNTGHNHKAPTI